MKKNPYKLDPSRSPLEPNTGYRRSGLLMAGLAAAIFVILGYVWSTSQGPTPVRQASSPPAAASTTGAAVR
ncbi:MAG TPA: hypothetical protein VE224_20310 [Pseudolabrys sp.]|nr:hypothetical protein [Pseudolabrys sp.]